MDFSNQEFVMVGSPIITKEVFRNVSRPLNNYSFKPTGGFWSAKYLGGCMHISDWYDYLEDADYIAMQKNVKDGVVFTLKDDAKILTISNAESIRKLAQEYPSYHHILNYNGNYPTEENLIFDFEALNGVYDGIYVNYDFLYNFLQKTKNMSFHSWSINTLLLFNLDCVEKYKTIEIVREKVASTGRVFIYAVDKEKDREIMPLSPYYKKLYSLVEDMFLDKVAKHNMPFKDYDEYLAYLVQTVNECIRLIKDNRLVQNIGDLIKNEGGTTREIVIRRNIVLNYLTNYLNNDRENIKKLKRSKHIANKSYPID